MASPSDDQKRVSGATMQLEDLSLAEYRASLAAVLDDPSRSLEDRLWRIGRLIGIAVKQPFAEPVDIEPGRSATGARRGWVLHPESVASAQDSWQYKLVVGLLEDRDLRREVWLGPNPDWAAEVLAIKNPTGITNIEDVANELETVLGVDATAAKSAARGLVGDFGHVAFDRQDVANRLWSDLALALQSPWHVEIALQEMHTERGLWRCMAKSAAKYLCSDEKLAGALNRSESGAGISRDALHPASVLGAGSVAAVDALTQALPWLEPSGAVVATGFLVIIGNIGLRGYCDWVRDYVDDKPESLEIES